MPDHAVPMSLPTGPVPDAAPSGDSSLAAGQDRDKLCRLADSAPVMMAYFDGPRQLCTYANRTFMQGLCDAARSPLGRALTDVMAPALGRQLSPALAVTLQDDQARTLEQPLSLRDGQQLWAEITLTPHLDPQGRRAGVYVLIVDQSRHHAAERALLESEERLSKFLQAGVEGIFFHRDGHIADANPALCEMVGLSLHDLLGRPALMLIAPEHQTHTLRQLDALQDVTFETAVVHQDGTRIPVEVIDRGTVQHGEPMRMAVVRDIRDRRATQARLHYLVHHDALTGLPNRAAFLAQLDHLMVAARASDTQLALLFIDLDHFKRVNDSVGHTRGDALLKTIAQRLCECVRSTDRVARFGGDEFMVLLPGVRDRDAVVRVAGKLLDAVGAPVVVEGQPISVTPSLGIALYPQDGDTPDVLIKHADAAMHVAKARGRATFAFFEQEVATTAYDQLMLEGELGHAITHDEFALLFQPQVRACDGHPVGVEALIRWQHPQRGLLAPDEFIALAEQHRLIVPIGAWVLREAARQAQQWHAAGWPLTVAVNLSTLQFQAPDFVASIQALLAETGLPAGWLELELTERMLMDDVPQVCARLLQLRALGVKLSVDDFGTGYSSLSHLKELPIDTMKIDRSFVQELPHQRESAAIASAIVQLARGLGLSVVAEGVETAAQRVFLVGLGCDQLQGMMISAPQTAAQLQAWLDRQPVPPHVP
jgi:diguanylate cyclase (GGDEF)-like protein/PAS domain S-box-containing protein